MHYMENHGVYCKHLSPPNQPGFVDLIACRENRITFIEVKDFNQIGPGEKMYKLFQEAQPSHYASLLKCGNLVYVVGYLHGVVMYVTISTQKQIDDMFLTGRDDYLHFHGLILPMFEILLP